jgi:magnesium chelatase family protein
MERYFFPKMTPLTLNGSPKKGGKKPMLSTTTTIILTGLQGQKGEIQTDMTGGIPGIEIIGLPDASVKEAKERIKSSIRNSGIEFPSRKFIINLAPADTKKEGASYDLPMAIGILVSMGELNSQQITNKVFIGELSLEGKIRKVIGILPICIEAKKLGIQTIIVPKENQKEASIVPGIEVIGVENLNELIHLLNHPEEAKSLSTKWEEIQNQKEASELDFSEIKGQEYVKRALEIAAAGGHNCLLLGSPGSGKTMLARRLPSILPELTFEEALEITKIHSVAGKLSPEEAIITSRPFRSPHHTITPASLLGGGKNPKPGEISLAHFGVLFLDELPEFSKSTLETLRTPIEDGFITISRVYSSYTYPCQCMLIASMNPCPCGYYGSSEGKCHCTKLAIQNYLGKISGPLLDRIDLHIEVKPVTYEKLDNPEKPESSEVIRKRVNRARKIQQNRYQNSTLHCNAELYPKEIEKYCTLDKSSRELLHQAFEQLGLSARAYSRILKVARTIADLAEKENIEIEHIAEAIGYRNLDKKYELEQGGK